MHGPINLATGFYIMEISLFFLNSDMGLKGPRELHPVYSWWVCFKIGALKETKAYNKVLNIYTNKKSDQALGPLHRD
jgi:hypothetical protein